jgi:tetratricopeptide (TPR) repeat protein
MATLSTLPADADRHAVGAGRVEAVRRLRQAARIARETGRVLRARRLYRMLVSELGDDGDALHWLGVLEQHLGRPAAARACLARAVALDQGSAQRRYHLAEALRAAGEHGEALPHYEAALAREPRIADVWAGYATALLALDRVEEAVEALERARELAPGDAGIATLLRQACAEAAFQGAERLRRRQHWRDAAACYRRALELDPGHAPALVNLATCLEQDGHRAAAEELYARAAAVDPGLAEAPLNQGIARAVAGDRPGARDALKRALAIRPSLGTAHYHLALLDDTGRNDAGRDADTVPGLERLLALPDLADDDRAQLGFALARRLDRLGEHDRAWVALEAANAVRRAAEPFDPAAHERLVGAMIKTLDRRVFAAAGSGGTLSELPLLVVGMPRSGTTLVEQILGAHPAAHGAGERPDLRLLARAVAAAMPDASLAAAIAGIDDAQATALGDRHVQRLAALAPAALRVIDKLPGNYLRLGLLARMAPHARIVWCRRDPLDTCLSCWFQSFADGQRFSYDLEALGLVHRLQERLMRHWRAVLPNPILEVRYEDLVAEPETVARALLAFAGLDWQPGCLDPASRTGAIRTSSLWQVREPIHDRSVGRWRNYAHHLKPLAAALNGHPGAKAG